MCVSVCVCVFLEITHTHTYTHTSSKTIFLLSSSFSRSLCLSVSSFLHRRSHSLSFSAKKRKHIVIAVLSGRSFGKRGKGKDFRVLFSSLLFLFRFFCQSKSWVWCGDAIAERWSLYSDCDILKTVAVMESVKERMEAKESRGRGILVSLRHTHAHTQFKNTNRHTHTLY